MFLDGNFHNGVPTASGKLPENNYLLSRAGTPIAGDFLGRGATSIEQRRLHPAPMLLVSHVCPRLLRCLALVGGIARWSLFWSARQADGSWVFFMYCVICECSGACPRSKMRGGRKPVGMCRTRQPSSLDPVFQYDSCPPTSGFRVAGKKIDDRAAAAAPQTGSRPHWGWSASARGTPGSVKLRLGPITGGHFFFSDTDSTPYSVGMQTAWSAMASAIEMLRVCVCTAVSLSLSPANCPSPLARPAISISIARLARPGKRVVSTAQTGPHWAIRHPCLAPWRMQGTRRLGLGTGPPLCTSDHARRSHPCRGLQCFLVPPSFMCGPAPLCLSLAPPLALCTFPRTLGPCLIIRAIWSPQAPRFCSLRLFFVFWLFFGFWVAFGDFGAIAATRHSASPGHSTVDSHSSKRPSP
jgi:hypothetical protein